MAESKANRRITISEIHEWDGSWELIDGTPRIGTINSTYMSGLASQNTGLLILIIKPLKCTEFQMADTENDKYLDMKVPCRLLFFRNL